MYFIQKERQEGSTGNNTQGISVVQWVLCTTCSGLIAIIFYFRDWSLNNNISRKQGKIRELLFFPNEYQDSQILCKISPLVLVICRSAWYMVGVSDIQYIHTLHVLVQSYTKIIPKDTHLLFHKITKSFHVHVATKKILIIWVMTPCSLLGCYLCFSGIYTFCVQGKRWKKYVPPRYW